MGDDPYDYKGRDSAFLNTTKDDDLFKKRCLNEAPNKNAQTFSYSMTENKELFISNTNDNPLHQIPNKNYHETRNSFTRIESNNIDPRNFENKFVNKPNNLDPNAPRYFDPKPGRMKGDWKCTNQQCQAWNKPSCQVCKICEKLRSKKTEIFGDLNTRKYNYSRSVESSSSAASGWDDISHEDKNFQEKNKEKRRRYSKEKFAKNYTRDSRDRDKSHYRKYDTHHENSQSREHDKGLYYKNKAAMHRIKAITDSKIHNEEKRHKKLDFEEKKHDKTKNEELLGSNNRFYKENLYSRNFKDYIKNQHFYKEKSQNHDHEIRHKNKYEGYKRERSRSREKNYRQRSGSMEKNHRQDSRSRENKHRERSRSREKYHREHSRSRERNHRECLRSRERHHRERSKS